MGIKKIGCLLFILLSFVSLESKLIAMESMNISEDSVENNLKNGLVLMPSGGLVSYNDLEDHNYKPRRYISVWEHLLEKYKNNSEISQLIFVKYINYSDADICFYEKDQDNSWQVIKNCEGYVGRKGIGAADINCDRTPEGDFRITSAFGIDPNPGTKLKYLKINKDLYCCGDSGKYFNKIIDITSLPDHRECSGEHLIDYPHLYDLGFWFDYNNECDEQKGGAFFFHCVNEKKYTGGCVSVKKEDMSEILKKLKENARLCIFDKEHTVSVD